jgi:hypothetical protein
MRLNRVATAFAAVSAGLTAAAVVRSRAAAHRRQEPAALRAGARPAAPTAPSPAPSPAPTSPPAAAPPTRPDPTVETVPADVQLPDGTAAEPEGTREAVVLAFVRPGTAQPAAEQPAAEERTTEQPAAPVRCGDTGGRTKAGAPCGARAGAGGRCRHHPAAA